jgi:hypothetical protein
MEAERKIPNVVIKKRSIAWWRRVGVRTKRLKTGVREGLCPRAGAWKTVKTLFWVAAKLQVRELI